MQLRFQVSFRQTIAQIDCADKIAALEPIVIQAAIADIGAVDKAEKLEYSIDTKGTTSRSVPQVG